MSVATLYTGQSIVIYNGDYISETIRQYRCWEPNITNIFNFILKDVTVNTAILDIGCNIGYYSLISIYNPHVIKIYSIDGNNKNIDMLKTSCQLNNIENIYPINMCISNEECHYKPGNRDIIDANGNIGGLNFIKSDNINDVISTTIDLFISKNSIDNIIIMKIDIEGGELNALKGAINTLKTDIIKNIIIEISPIFNHDSIDILSILSSNNYKIYNIPHKECGPCNDNEHFLKTIMNNEILDIDLFVRSIEVQTNVLAVKIIRAGG